MGLGMAMPGLVAWWALAEVEAVNELPRVRTSGLAVAPEVCRCPMWWRAWREPLASRGGWAAEADLGEAGAVAVTQARKKFTQFLAR